MQVTSDCLGSEIKETGYKCSSDGEGKNGTGEICMKLRALKTNKKILG
jgi:hypothetical protein